MMTGRTVAFELKKRRSKDLCGQLWGNFKSIRFPLWKKKCLIFEDQMIEEAPAISPEPGMVGN